MLSSSSDTTSRSQRWISKRVGPHFRAFIDPAVDSFLTTNIVQVFQLYTGQEFTGRY